MQVERQRELIKNKKEKWWAYIIKNRTRHTFISEIVSKNYNAVELLGCTHKMFKQGLKLQFIKDMILEKHDSIRIFDPTLPLSVCKLLDEEEMRSRLIGSI